ncbi:histone chaperone RTT106-like [Vigna umbellata]|uniref:histone chaperone RTT106-like n=1 Tax=Vigna umbellata TaxID=87088 RepID=UPI001F5F6151|nr:histone chaperone RTT106-like [Vigna umbellata]
MVRTRGVSSSRGDASCSRGEPSSSSRDERRRPTASARRRRVQKYRVDVIHEDEYEELDEIIQQGYGEDDYVEQEDVQQQDDYSEEEDEDGDEDEDEAKDEAKDGGFPGGPCDTSLLTHYTHHVAFAIWQGRDRGEIKVMSHGKKLKHFGMYHEAIEPYVCMSGLAFLVNLSYEYVDHD